MMRKCQVLLDLGQIKECEQNFPMLEEIAFQSEKSQIIYNEIKNLKERIADPIGWRDKQTKIKKEQDWYYTFKQEEKRQKKEE